MRDIGIIYMAEVVRRLRSRAYAIATLAGIVFIALISLAPTLLVRLAHNESNTLVLAGPPAIRTEAQTLLAKRYRVVATLDRLPLPVTQAFLDSNGHAAAAVELSFVGKRLHAEVYARDPAAFGEIEFNELAPLALQLGTGIPPATTKPLLRVVRNVHGLDAKFASASGAALAHGIAFALVFMLYLSIVTSGQAVLSGVAEEKTSRIAELLVATISPISLMTGKTIAIASTTLLQLALWGLTAVVLLPQTFASGNVETQAVSFMALAAISPSAIAAFFLFFIFGFLQYSTVYAAAASLVSRTEDLGSVSGPVILPAVAAFVLAQYALYAPNAPVVVVASFIPFVSPFIMFTRIAISSTPEWQIVAAVIINAVASALCFYLAGKVYRVGMLMYGKLPTIRQVVAAIRA